MVDYHFYNANPLGEIEGDCVIRAISYATGLSYEDIEYKLYLIGELFECDMLCVCCYYHLLEKVFGLTPKYANGRTVEDLARDYQNDTLIIRIDGHLTMSRNGIVYDIWDCRKEPADIFWIVD